MFRRFYNQTWQGPRRKVLRNDATFAERILWRHIRNSLLGYKFRRQHGIGKYIVDFSCPQLKIIIELDGSIHDFEENKRKDKIRQNFLEQQGYIVLRYRNEQITSQLDTVLEDIQKQCDRISIQAL